MSKPESKHDVLLDSLKKFYDDSEHLRSLTRVLRNESGISLRILDWLVTNYSKKHNICYVLPNGVPFNMFLAYKAQLKAYSKQLFDPFARRKRLEIPDGQGGALASTCGQLNFFRWALGYGVVDYGIAHAREIEQDMMLAIKHRSDRSTDRSAADAAAAVADAAAAVAASASPASPETGEKPRRKELSKAAVKTCTRTVVHVVVKFT
jgi:hypothetical protein